MLFLTFLLLASTPTMVCALNQHPVTYLYSHGVGDCHKQAYLYTKIKQLALPDKVVGIGDRYLVDGPMITFDYPDASEVFWKVKRNSVHFAQEHDLACLEEAYDKTCCFAQENFESTPDIVMLGMSRGASAILNFVALNNPEEIKALVLESPFDTTTSIVKALLDRAYISWVPGMLSLGSIIMKQIFKNYKHSGLNTIDTVKDIAPTLPILLISSKKDWLIPATSTGKIYKTLRATGHDKVHILVLNNGTHAKLFAQEDGDIYQNVTHAFFRHYNLPHNPAFAQAGQAKFEQCQPTRDELKTLLK